MSAIVQANSGNTISIGAEQDGAVNNLFSGGKDVVIGGILNEFGAIYSSSSLQVSVGTGQAIINGRSLRANESNSVTLNASATTYLVWRIDLSQLPGSEGLLVQLSSLVNMESDDLNSGGTKHDMLLYTIVTDASGVTSVTDNRNIKSIIGMEIHDISVAVADWTLYNGCYQCTKALQGVKPTDYVHFQVEVDMTDATNRQSQINARAYTQDLAPGTDEVTIYSTNLPDVEVIVKVWGF